MTTPITTREAFARLCEFKWQIAAIGIGLTVGFCAPPPATAQELRDPYLDALQQDRTRADQRDAERDMQDRRERYEAERRREVRENDRYFNWDSSWNKREQRRNKH